MKTSLLILILAAGTACAGDTLDALLQQQQLFALQNMQRQQQQALRNAQLQSLVQSLERPRIPDAIYQSYPNNPALYRYLDRNPRYIPYYLGR